MANVQLIPRIRAAFNQTNFERVTQPVTDFIRGNPILAGVVLGSGGALSTLAVASVVKRTVTRKKRKKKTATRSRRKTTRRKRGRKRSKAEIKRVRLRNLVKARRARKRGPRRRIIRGPGLGTREIRHSGKSTKGKFKVVSFRDKRTGKLVRFKARK